MVLTIAKHGEINKKKFLCSLFCFLKRYLAGCIFAKQEKRELALKYFREAIDCSRPWPSAYYKLSRLVADPLEKRALYDNFVSAQRKMAEEEEGTNQIDQSPLSRDIQKQ